MSQKQGSSKKARTPKKSQGIHGGGGKVKLTRLQLALLGKGPSRGLTPKDPITPWLGTGSFHKPADPIQAQENRKLYPHLFTR